METPASITENLLKKKRRGNVEFKWNKYIRRASERVILIMMNHGLGNKKRQFH